MKNIVLRGTDWIWVIATVFLFVSHVTPGWAETAPQSGIIIIEREDLHKAGITRLGDIHILFDEWASATVDGFTWTMSPLGLGPYGHQQWRIAIDGKPVEINLFGISNLNRLPISVNQIRRIHIYTAPCFVGGEKIDAGLIDIETEKEASTWRAHMSAANETGDPGPYYFTSLKTPNVDRLGPDFSIGLNRGIGPAYIDANVSTLSNYPTDPAILLRNHSITGGGELSIHVMTSSLRLSGPLLGGIHRLFVGYSWIEDYFFFKPYGREIPVDSRLMHVDLDGELPVGATTRLTYRLAFNSGTLEKRKNTFDLDFDWETRTRAADLKLVCDKGDISGKLGASFKSTKAKTRFELSDNETVVTNFYGEFSRRFTRTLPTLGAVLSMNGEDVAISGYLSTFWVLSTGSVTTGFQVAYMQRLPEQDSRIWFWDERGYFFLEDSGIAVNRDGNLATTQTITTDLFFEKRFYDRSTFEVRGLYRDFTELQLEEQVFQYEPSDLSFLGPVNLLSAQSGCLAGVQATLDLALPGNVSSRLLYRYQTEVGGDATFKNNWKTVPKNHARLVVDYQPVQNLSLWAALYYRSGTTWADYREVEAQSGGRYRSSIDDVLTIDVTIQKWFWKRKLRTNLGFRNLLNDTIRYHPIGASFDLTAFLQVELLLAPTF